MSSSEIVGLPCATTFFDMSDGVNAKMKGDLFPIKSQTYSKGKTILVLFVFTRNKFYFSVMYSPENGFMK